MRASPSLHKAGLRGARPGLAAARRHHRHYRDDPDPEEQLSAGSRGTCRGAHHDSHTAAPRTRPPSPQQPASAGKSRAERPGEGGAWWGWARRPGLAWARAGLSSPRLLRAREPHSVQVSAPTRHTVPARTHPPATVFAAKVPARDGGTSRHSPVDAPWTRVAATSSWV